MKKMKLLKLLTVVLFILGAGGAALAVEVINIDINGDACDIAYTGFAGYDGGTDIWRVYYIGWGKAMGSQRSADLADYNEPNKPSTYAAQVWIGDDTNVPHGYLTGTGLMDDGFVKTGGPADPNPGIYLFGRDAYGGYIDPNIDPNFDIYVYGANDGNFTLTCPLCTPAVEVKHVDGWASPGFVQGKNYVIFEAVPISYGANSVTLSYDNVLNGVQLVKRKYPVAVGDGTIISAPDYDVAYESNQRTGGGTRRFGPDIVGDPVPLVTYLDVSEYMEYDITVDEANEGYYDIVAYFTTPEGEANNLDIYVDSLRLGTLTLMGTYVNPTVSDNYVSGNLFEGSHTFKWVSPGPYLWFNIATFKFTRVGDIVIADCNDVYKYGFDYAADYTGDCHVDEEDLALMVDNWLNCYDPNTDNCP